MQKQFVDGATTSDYVEILAKRKVVFAAAFAIVMLVFIALAYWLPPVYRSVGTVLIEQPEIAEGSANRLIEERLQTITSRATTTDIVVSLIERHRLYRDMKSATVDERVNRFLDSMFFEPLSAESLARSGRNVISTYAFNLSFDDRDPQAAKAVATALIDLYLEAHTAERGERAGRTRSFYEAEVRRLADEITGKEEALAEFKSLNAERLPELAFLNMQVRSDLERDISGLDSRILEARARAELLDAELAMAQKEFGRGNELDALQEDYVRLSSRYSPDHPDVIRVRQQIESITGGSAMLDGSAIEAEIEALDERLAEMLTRYAAGHPDVVAAKRQRVELEQRLSNTGDNQPIVRDEALEVREVRTRRANVMVEIAALRGRREVLMNDLSEYRMRLVQLPRVEKEYNALIRGYENAIAEHQEMLSNLHDAKLVETLETKSQGERLTVLESPRLPETPLSPNRTAVLALGLVLAMGAAVGLIAVLDSLDATIRGRHDCAKLYGASPIAVIPYIDVPGTLTSPVRERTILISIGVILTLATVLIVMSRAGS